MKSPRNNKRGFTLVEMLVYVAILAVLTVTTTNTVLSMMKVFADLRVSRDVNSSATVLFERLTRDIRSAYSIDTTQSTFGANPGRLTLNTKDAAGVSSTIEYYVDPTTNVVKVKEGGVLVGSVMTAGSTITNFMLYQLSSANSNAVKVEATISETKGGITKTRNFYTTIVLRGSY